MTVACEKYKNRKADSFKKDETEQIAGAIGWITHRASDLQMKPIFRILEDKNHPVFHDNECQMYHDAIVFKEVYQGGTVSTKSQYEKLSPATLAHGMKGNPASAYVNVPLTENVFTHYFMSEFAKQQHFINDINDINDINNIEIINISDLNKKYLKKLNIDNIKLNNYIF